MDLKDLKLNRFGAKDANQADQTKDSVYTSSNPTPKQIDQWRKMGQGNRSSEEDRGAPNVMTGTVITSCFIQTSALPSRVEIAGNDITFFDDTYARDGRVVGDTSRIVWTYASARDSNNDVSSGFIMEKRSSVYDTYDNVFSFFYLPPKEGRMNYMYFGRDGRSTIDSSYTNYALFNINHDSNAVINTLPDGRTNAGANGAFVISGSVNSVYDNTPLFGVYHNSLLGVLGDGYSLYLAGRGTGGVYLFNTYISLPGGITWLTGSGSPEGVVTAPVGSIYSNTSGGVATTLYVKTSGVGNTGWTAK